MPLTPQGLKIHLDRALPNTGAIGEFALIDDSLTTNLAVAANTTADTLTSATAHNLVDGSRFRVATTGVLPDPLSASVDYYAQIVNATTLKPCASLDDAILGNPVNLTSVGSNLVINEQTLTASDTDDAILAHEVTGNGYARQSVADIGPSVILGGQARKNPVTWTQAATGGAIVYQHIAFVDSVLNKITYFDTLTTPKTIAAGDSQIISYQFSNEN